MDVENKSHRFDPAEMGALAHLYRAEVYRSTVWRTRLDNTTNWAVVTTGVALSVSFSHTDASPLPLVIVGLLVVAFLMLEGRRYRYFHLYRARARVMENGFYVPILNGDSTNTGEWSDVLSRNYRNVTIQIGIARAIGRRLRSNYAWILIIQAIAYYLKLIVHPQPMASFSEILDRAAIGPISGLITIGSGIIFHLGWIMFAVVTLHYDRKDWSNREARSQPAAAGR